MSVDARPRKKARMSQEGLTGERTFVVERVAERKREVSERDRVLEFLVDGEWREVPNERWAWSPSHITYRRCRKCGFSRNCQHSFWWGDYVMFGEELGKAYDYTAWTPKLLRATEAKQVWLVPGALEPLSRPRGVRDVATSAGQLPEELFQFICGSVDDKKLARTCRLVCRYWNKQCRRAVFKRIALVSGERVFNLAREFKHDPAWQHIPPLVEEIWLSDYTARTKAPWMHLLDPGWKRDKLLIEGPFPGHQTLRSIHFALPRSLPRSFSRGFTQIMLMDIHFGRFEDTTCLASELPDLEELDLHRVKWNSLPTEVPRRRPRADRNKLREVTFFNCSVTGVERPSFVFAAWTLILGVSRPSPLDSLDATHALVQAVDHRVNDVVKVERDCKGRLSGLDISGLNSRSALRFRFESLMGKDPLFVLDCATHWRWPSWSELKPAIALLPHSGHLRFLFGLESRKDMLHCAADVVTSLSSPGEVRYAISQREAREGDFWMNYWYEATLESEELKGKGVYDIIDVYADW